MNRGISLFLLLALVGIFAADRAFSQGTVKAQPATVGTVSFPRVIAGARDMLDVKAAAGPRIAEFKIKKDGVLAEVRRLREELDLAMALCGCTSVGEITTDLIV